MMNVFDSITYQVFRQNAYHNASGYSGDIQYDYVSGHGPEGVLDIVIPKSGLAFGIY